MIIISKRDNILFNYILNSIVKKKKKKKPFINPITTQKGARSKNCYQKNRYKKTKAQMQHFPSKVTICRIS